MPSGVRRGDSGGDGTGAQAFDATHDQTGGDLQLLRFGREGGEPVSAISASEIRHWPSSSQTALGYLIGVQASSSMRVMAALTEAFIRTVMENRAPSIRQELTTSAP